MFTLPRPFDIHLRVRPHGAGPRITRRAAAVAIAVLLWQLLLVLSAAFFHYGEPERYILSALELPSLMALHELLREQFAVASAVGGIVIGAAVLLLLWRRAPKLCLFPIASMIISLIGGLRAGEPLTLSRIEGSLRTNYLLCLAMTLYILRGLRRTGPIHLPRRPVLLTLAGVAGSASLFYFLLEASTKGEWSDFTGRFAFFLVASLGLALLRGLLVGPALALGTPRPIALGAHWLVVDFLVPFLFARLLALHAGNIFPFLLMTDQPPTVFFDSLGIWIGFLLLSFDLGALAITGGSLEAFGKRFSSLDTPGILPLVPLDRLLERRLHPRLRFLLTWSLILAALGTLVGVYRGGFLFYLIGPPVYALCLYVWVVFVSQAAVIFAPPLAPGRGSRRIGMSFAGALVGLLLLLPLFQRGSLERTVRLTFRTLREIEYGKYLGLIAKARRFEHSYQVEKAGEGDFQGYNLVLLTSDSLRAANLGCYGYRRPTSPRMDALAADSIRFTSAFTSANHTYSSISSLLRGDLRDRPVPELDGTWLKALVDHGAFARALIYNSVMLHLPRLGETDDIRFIPEFDLEERDLFREKLETVKDRPFLIWVHNKGTHKLFPSPHAPAVFGSGPMDIYDNNIRYFDSFVGFTLDLLREKGLDRKTLVIISSDHGELFNDHGGWGHGGDTFYDPLIRIPLLAHVPGRGPRLQAACTTLTDLGPTLLEAFGLRVKEMPAWVRSRRNTLIGGEEAEETRVLPLTSLHYQSVGIYRTDGLKFFITAKSEYLFNTHLDPGEQQNLVRFSTQAESEGRRLCHEMFGLDGPVDPPAGASR